MSEERELVVDINCVYRQLPAETRKESKKKQNKDKKVLWREEKGKYQIEKEKRPRRFTAVWPTTCSPVN